MAEFMGYMKRDNEQRSRMNNEPVRVFNYLSIVQEITGHRIQTYLEQKETQ